MCISSFAKMSSTPDRQPRDRAAPRGLVRRLQGGLERDGRRGRRFWCRRGRRRGRGRRGRGRRGRRRGRGRRGRRRGRGRRGRRRGRGRRGRGRRDRRVLRGGQA